jgi:hypothetical protein
VELELKRWKRFGHDRTYVGPADGPSLGYLDNTTGEVHVVDEAHLAEVLTALGIGAPSAEAEQPSYAVSVERLATDLAGNKPGERARQMAREQRDAAPVRTLLSRVLGVHTDERAWRVGAQGERWVAEHLDKLVKRGWTVVHDVSVGERDANIDHVVVGPGGVFTVNTKYHVGKRVWCAGETVKVGGYGQPYVRYARHEATRASRLLSAVYGEHVPVMGLVVILTEPDNWTQKQQPADGSVLVMRARAARKHLEGLPVRYAVHEVDRLVLWARRDTTWRP